MHVPCIRSRLALRLIIRARLNLNYCLDMMPRKTPIILKRIRAGALPLAILFKNRSFRANDVRFGLVIGLPPRVTGQWGVVVIEENNRFGSS